MKKHSWTPGTIWKVSFPVFKLGPLGTWPADSRSPSYLIKESSSLACRAEGLWVRTRPWPLEPCCLGLALHEDVKLAKARVWARGDWDRKGFLGKRKSPFALWLKVLAEGLVGLGYLYRCDPPGLRPAAVFKKGGRKGCE